MQLYEEYNDVLTKMILHKKIVDSGYMGCRPNYHEPLDSFPTSMDTPLLAMPSKY